MEQEKENISIEEGDFITPKKAITITTISMVIWFITGGTYALLHLFFKGIDYLTYTFIVSFILSILFSIYIVMKLVRKTDLIMKIMIGALNAALIYTSVNGAQATYGFLNPKDSSSAKTINSGFLIPFLDPRPWIPDKILMAENETLINENNKLISEKEELTRQNGFLQTRNISLRDSMRQTLPGTSGKILLLYDSITSLNGSLATCMKQSEEMIDRLKKCENEKNRSKPGDQSTLEKLKSIRDGLEKKVASLTSQLESIKGRIRQFNARQDQWRQRTTARVSNNPDNNISRIMEITGSIKKNVNGVMNDNTYYDFLFLTPINDK